MSPSNTESVIIQRSEPLLNADADVGAAGSGSVTLAKDVTLSFGHGRLSWATANGSETGFNTADVLGCSVKDGPPRIILHAAPRSRGGCFGVKPPGRMHVDKVLICTTFEQATSTKAALDKLLGTSAETDAGCGPRKPWLVLINPFGGGGKASHVWAELEKLLEPLGLVYDITHTTHAGHAAELAAELMLGAYEGVMSVSGDGLVFEFVNGLMSRPDGAAAAAATPLFPVPGGSANGLFRSICDKANEKDDLLGAAIILAKGQPMRLDLWEYFRPDPALLTGAGGSAAAGAAAPAAAATAPAAAVDGSGSGGSASSTQAGLPKMLARENSRYGGPRSLGSTGSTGPSFAANEPVGWSFLSFAWGLVSDVDIESEVLRSLGSLRFTLWAVWRVLTLRKYSGTLHYLDAADDTWKKLASSAFVGIWACNVPYMSQTDYAAPQAEFDNGVLDVLVLCNSTRFQALDIFLSMEDGSHLGKKGLELLKVKGFRFEPAPRTPSRPGILDIDGELVPFGPIEAKAHPGGLRVMCL